LTRPTVPRALRRRVERAAGVHCGYCLTSVLNSGIPLELEHIIPAARGGATVEEDLWLSCVSCNRRKADRIAATDPLTGVPAALFNPRTQRWSEHFTWSTDGVLVVGITDTGRATLTALDLNHPARVAARRRWVAAGWHPPRD
jgi:5-methylcytosine-specific restriction endonuclease McrA